METGIVVAVMFYVTSGFWSGEQTTFVATYKNLETCRKRIELLCQNENFTRTCTNSRYCRLEAVVEKP